MSPANETRRQSPKGPDTAFAPGAGMAAAPDHSNVSPAEETDK